MHVAEYGSASVVMIDAYQPDRTTLQHGIAWRVDNASWGTADGEGPTMRRPRRKDNVRSKTVHIHRVRRISGRCGLT